MEIHDLPLMSSSKLRRLQAPPNYDLTCQCAMRTSVSLPFPHARTLSKLPKFNSINRLFSKASTISSRPPIYNGSSSSRSLLVHSKLLGDEETISPDDVPIIFFKRMVKFVGTTWRLLRPYVLYGWFAGAFSWTARAFLEKPPGGQIIMGLPSILQGLSALFVIICLQGFVTGINLIYDLDIDKINKPYLPISSGDMSLKTAWILVLSMAAIGFAVTLANRARPLTLSLYCMYVIVGALYSAPPFRFKRHPFGAFLTMISLGGILVNLGLYNAVKDTLNFPFPWNFHATFITAFTTILSFVYALTKDLSDVEGDRKHNVVTLASVLGLRKTTFLGAGILLSVYVAIMAMPVLMPHAFRGALVVPVHGLFSMFLIFQVWLLEKAKYSKEACLKFYLSLWYLHYGEYIILPFI